MAREPGIVALALAVLLVAGCVGSSVSYHFKGDGKGNVGRSDTYANTWDAGGPALVSWRIQGSGSVEVTIKDAQGREAFHRTLSGTSQDTFRIGADAPGPWELRYAYHRFLGEFSLDADRV
jgi:hypothetical protein